MPRETIHACKIVGKLGGKKAEKLAVKWTELV
jgi:hypothetical protein